MLLVLLLPILSYHFLDWCCHLLFVVVSLSSLDLVFLRRYIELRMNESIESMRSNEIRCSIILKKIRINTHCLNLSYLIPCMEFIHDIKARKRDSRSITDGFIFILGAETKNPTTDYDNNGTTSRQKRRN